jgi:hypothetical protein
MMSMKMNTVCFSLLRLCVTRKKENFYAITAFSVVAVDVVVDLAAVFYNIGKRKG